MIGDVMPRVRGAAAGLAAVLILAACGSGYQRPRVAVPVPDGVRSPAPRASPEPSGCEPRNSLAAATSPPPRLTGGSRKIRAGVDQTMTRMAYRDPATGEFRGFDVDLVLEVAKEMFPGRDPRDTVVFVAITPAERQERLRDGTVDIVADSMTATCGRAARMAYSTDYLDSGQTVLLPGNSPHRRIGDLAGRPVCAPADTTAPENLRKRPEGLLPVTARNPADCLVMLQQGQVAAISAAHNVLLGLQDLDPATRFLPVPPPRPRDDPSCLRHRLPAAGCTWFSDEPHALAFRREDTEFVKFVNHVLEKIRGNGRWREIHDRWLLDHPDQGPPPARYGPNPTWPPGR
ncbi:transporter substrate-binding domain-containing protein [Actinomadura graeca]|uniref:Transporter substrate-binding domain-containing protein n=1 Tax=Actinomadura graeca TaxID=2750812 RepID=A0ABX8R3S4_9ACTN|nr:transporter substrate-binding domain-containing protein [Actinomadura graeca]QXJ25716.1 transporter substrate-binding domain-containing protein [Actinomadura graeca]